MELNKLFKTDNKTDIKALVSDSRNVVNDSIFFCIEGFSVDRHEFIDQAIDKGAVAIVHSKDVDKKPGISYFKVDNVYKELERVVDLYFDTPSKKLKIYGVTGTNGKSTMTSTLRHVLNRLGENTGYIGTISIEYNDKVLEPTLTTPDIIEMNSILKDMVDAGVTSVALEVSSQGLALNRVDTIDFDTVAFTNLSLEHLDYHKTMENYYLAKKHLFDLLKEEGVMVVNIDDSYGQRLYDEVNIKNKYSVSLEKSADYRVDGLNLDKDRSEFNLHVDNKVYPVITNMVAKFNVYNTVEVIAMLHQSGYDLEKVIAAIENLPSVKGRVNFIDNGQDFNAVVDYSHTPDGFEKIYTYLKEITSGRLITVYGNAGGRDHSKRPIMGAISAKFCDLLVITEQDRRTEDVSVIKDEMLRDVKVTPYEFIPKRFDAIYHALSIAEKGDTVVVLGKGDERFQHGPEGLEAWPGDDKVVYDILQTLKEKNNK